MKLIDLDIQRMPGFEKEGFAYRDLGEGVHVIWGPNGSGKSTTCKAIKALLWPEQLQRLHPILLQSHWKWKSGAVSVSREGSHNSIQEEIKVHLGSVSSSAYFFTLDDLFEEREKDLAMLLSNEMHGGYDLSELWQKFDITPRFGVFEANQVFHLGKELEKVGREQSKIVESEEGLSQINDEIERVQAANDELEQIECALECVKLKQGIQEIKAPQRKTSSFGNRQWFLLLSAVALLLLFFVGWFLAFLPGAGAFFFLRRYLSELDRTRQEENSAEQRRVYLEGRLSQAVLNLNEKGLLNCSLEYLEEKQGLLSCEVSKLESLYRQKEEIEREVQIALRTKRFDEVNEKIQSAKNTLENKRAEAKNLLLGRAFLRRIEERFEQEQQPVVLQKASEYFERFSFGAYTFHALSLDAIRIWDAKKERYIKLNELSYGLRIQLLLALRLGFLSSSEKESLRLPLFMDEILCHIDDDRLSNVADAIMQIGQERQIFIFTCQRSSFENWKNLGARAIDLEEIQGKQRMQRSPIQLAAKQKFPRAPSLEEDTVSYARSIGLCSPNLSLTFADQPSWIVLGSAQEIYQMHCIGIRAIGHLLIQPCSESIQEKCNLLKKALELALIGKTSKISRSDLEIAMEQGMFSETFLDALDACSKKVGGDAKSLLEALKNKEVKRFLGKYIEKLENYFLEKGFLDLREPLPREEIRKQLYESAVSHSPETLEFITYILSLFVANKSDGMSQSCL